ncbi:MAG: methionine--tRNA ligase subunit beta, partial [Gammaproteobacteria bacterium]
HGFLTVDGQKMSQSRGTFVAAENYVRHLNPEYLRYYFAAKLGAALEDIDLNLEDFELRVNADLVGKFVNIASRCAGFISKRFGGVLSDSVGEPALLADFIGAADGIAACYEGREYARAMREIMALADRANQYIDQNKPWEMARREGAEAELQRVCSMGIFLFRVLAAYLKPVLPVTVAAAESFLGGAALTWAGIGETPTGATINKFKPLMQRVEKEKIERMIEAGKEATPGGGAAGADDDHITIDDFAKVDLRVARIKEAGHVDGADKLVRLVLDLGGEERQVFAGIKQAYAPDTLVGRHVVMVANLAPRKMRFGVSEGMVLGAGPGGADIFLVSPDSGATAGMKVK